MVYLVINSGGQIESAHETDREARACLATYISKTPEAGPFEVIAMPLGERPPMKPMRWQTQTPIFLTAGQPLEVTVTVLEGDPETKFMFKVERKTGKDLTSLKPECLKGNIDLWLDSGVDAPLQAMGPSPSFTVRRKRVPPGTHTVRITSQSTSPALFFLGSL